MYCSQCGNQLAGNEKFCAICGAAVAGNRTEYNVNNINANVNSNMNPNINQNFNPNINRNINQNSNLPNNTNFNQNMGPNINPYGYNYYRPAVANNPVSMYIALVMSIFNIIIIFFSWVIVPGLFGNTGLSLFRLFLVDSSDLTDGATTVYVIVLLLTILMIVSNIIFIIKLLVNYRKSTGMGLFAFIVSLVLPVLFCIMIKLTNEYINSNSWFISYLMKIGAAPILMIINAIAGIVLVSVLRKNTRQVNYQPPYYMYK